MIEWKKFDGRTAPEELSEDTWLILVNGRIVEATHNAMEKYFTLHMKITKLFMHIIQLRIMPKPIGRKITSKK